jgi:hypothetical protein
MFSNIFLKQRREMFACQKFFLFENRKMYSFKKMFLIIKEARITWFPIWNAHGGKCSMTIGLYFN